MHLISAGVVKRTHIGVDCISKYGTLFIRQCRSTFNIHLSFIIDMPCLQWFRQFQITKYGVVDVTDAGDELKKCFMMDRENVDSV